MKQKLLILLLLINVVSFGQRHPIEEIYEEIYKGWDLKPAKFVKDSFWTVQGHTYTMIADGEFLRVDTIPIHKPYKGNTKAEITPDINALNKKYAALAKKRSSVTRRALGETIYQQPIYITKPGTYTGNYKSDDPNTPAILINCYDSVIITGCNLVSQGEMIKAYGGSRLNIHHNNIKGELMFKVVGLKEGTAAITITMTANSGKTVSKAVQVTVTPNLPEVVDLVITFK